MNLHFCQHDVFQFLFRRGTGPDLIPWHPVLCSVACLTYKKAKQFTGASSSSRWPAVDQIAREWQKLFGCA